jgi:CheY-specific phosphatase CheX
MSTDSNISLVTKNTIQFAEAVCETILEMVGVEFKVYSEVFTDNEISLQEGLMVLIPFSGRIQGNFYLCLEEKIAAVMCGAYQDGMSITDLHKKRSDYSSFMLEVINVAAAKTISKLESAFKPLFALPPYVFYGKAEMPNITSGDVVIKSDSGTVQCALSIDLAKLHSKENEMAENAAKGAKPVAVRRIKSEEALQIGKMVSQIKATIDRIDSILEKSKIVFLEDTTKVLARKLKSITAPTGVTPHAENNIIEDFQLIDKALRVDQANIKESAAAILNQLDEVRKIIATCSDDLDTLGPQPTVAEIVPDQDSDDPEISSIQDIF